jgi:hypothetical protein
MKIGRTVACLGVFAVCLAASHARAVTVTIEFEAIVRSSTGTPPTPTDGSFFRAGQVFSGSFSYDSTALDTTALSYIGAYPEALTAGHMDYLLGIDPYPPGPFSFGDLIVPAGVTVFNPPAPGATDRLFLGGYLDLSTFSTAGGNRPSITDVVLTLVAPGFLNGDQLPLAAPAFASLVPFDPQNICSTAASNLCFGSVGGTYLVGAEITALHTVPEPASAALALVAWAALACFRKGSRGSIAG